MRCWEVVVRERVEVALADAAARSTSQRSSLGVPGDQLDGGVGPRAFK